MKHTYSISVLTAAAALSLLAFASSCAKISIDKPDQAEQYIDFATDVETKAPVKSSADMDEFAVWAYRSDDALSLPEEEMHGIHVYPSSNGNWVYDNIRMWTDGIWHFEAMYPDPNTLGQALIGVDFYIPKSEGQAEMVQKRMWILCWPRQTAHTARPPLMQEPFPSSSSICYPASASLLRLSVRMLLSVPLLLRI
jgi:hypothetical protein